MAGMGPPPNPNARRRNARPGGNTPTVLPAEGRSGPAPKWPLPGKMQAGELAAWRELWATPQAVAWERLGWVRTVARYCRVMVRAEAPDAPAVLSGEARQFEDRLGLTPLAMSRMRPPWTISSDEIAERRDERTAAKTPPASSRARLKVVDAVGQ